MKKKGQSRGIIDQTNNALVLTIPLNNIQKAGYKDVCVVILLEHDGLDLFSFVVIFDFLNDTISFFISCLICNLIEHFNYM